MKIVYSDKDIDKVRPYKGYKFTKYPKNYPALISFESCDGGLMGDYYLFEIIEIPSGLNPKSFMAGVLAKPKVYSESNFLGKKN